MTLPSYDAKYFFSSNIPAFWATIKDVVMLALSLQTPLNIAANGSMQRITEIASGGNVVGADNTKLNVNKSVLINSGEVNVVNKSALTDMGNSAAADMAAVAQQNGAVNNIVGERLTTAYEKTKLDPSINSDIWVNFAKDWGETRSGANYHFRLRTNTEDISQKLAANISANFTTIRKSGESAPMSICNFPT